MGGGELSKIDGHLSGKRRYLMLKVANDQLSTAPMLFYIQQFTHCDLMLEWLIKNRLTGMNLVEWVSTMHKGSPLSAVDTITRFINSGHKLTGKDLIE